MTALIRGLSNIASAPKNSVITIGNFDGVHIGHQALLKKIVEKAKTLKTTSLVIIFEPQPFEFFAKTPPSPRLTRWREKFCLLAKAGLDAVLIIRFNQAFAHLTAEQFVQTILKDALQAKYIIVGDDFQFGRGREGDFAYLKKMGQQLGMTVENTQSVILENERVSSTQVRKALADSNHKRTRELLGRPYSMKGRVVHGDKRGRKIGFPTANIYLHRPVAPVQGVYIVRMHGVADHGLPGVANVGIRPTMGGTRSLLEVHLFNFSEEIYGRHVTVEFVEKIRDEQRFSDLNLLVEQIGKDAKYARRYFEERGEL
ncbi:MAG TPA: bifunctional riboflavin kinase/FAD synthetase [Gammaproteobacteria bacterium]|nr:bifunctional riboflavin kinase/FAD synthetase [Gammaproteobacteria bacterium]